MSTYPHTAALMKRGTDFLGCETAILCGAMSWVSERNLVAAISNAGGFGVIACGAMTPELLDTEIAAHPAASAVILADRDSDTFAFEGLADALALGDTDVRIFGKPVTRPYRRMGVALARDADAPAAVDLAKQAAAAVRIVYSPTTD